MPQEQTTPQNEAPGEQQNAGSTQPAPAETPTTFTQADLDKRVSEAVENAKSAWNEERERLKKAQARAEKLEKALESRPEAQQLEQMQAELADARGKLTGYRTEVISSRVASELSADASVVATMINGLRATGTLEQEPEDPQEAAKAWTEKLREKHGAFFEQPKDPKEPKQQRRQGRIPHSENATGETPEQAFEKRRRAQAKSGGGNVRF